MIEVNSFAELRTTKPSKAGEIAMLTRYYDKDNKFTGGGLFVGFPQTKDLPADDGGTVALDQGKTFFWKRIINDPLEINLFHFGGKCDGVTDDSDAFYRNFMWAKGLYTMSDAIGVHIPTGVCFIKPIDFTKLGEIPVFAVYGNTRAKGGWRPTVKIVSDKSTNTVFKVKARRTIMEGIEWDGQATADVANIVGAVQESDISNLQPFFENICPAGEYCNLFGMKFSNTGGTAIKLIDTLDTKFDQIYSSKTYGKVFDIGWSDTVAGGWNHSTAISWQNSNLQYGYGPCTVNMPRVGQGLVRNVWIEHQRFPGNMDNGQWVVEALSIESSDNPMNMNNSRLSINGAYFQSGGGMTNDRVAGSTLSGYEKGWIRQETYGMELHDASFRAGYFSGYKITNNTDKDLWAYIGSFNFRRMSATWQIDFLGKRDKVAPTGKLQKPSDMDGMGRRTVTLQRASDKVYADMSQEGKDAILDVRYQKLWGDNAKVWVKLAANSGDTIFNLTATGPTRFEAGDCNLYSSDSYVLTDATEIAALEALFAKGGDYAVPQNRFSLHNGLAGIGANEQGLLTLQTKEGSKPSAKDPAGYISVNINGVDRLMPYF